MSGTSTLYVPYMEARLGVCEFRLANLNSEIESPNITPERKDEAFAERDRELIHLGKITTLLEPERKAVEAKDPMTA